MKKFILPLIITASAWAQSLPQFSSWTKDEVVLESAYQALLLYNWKQSSQVHKTNARPSTDGYGHTLTYPSAYPYVDDMSPFLKKNASQGAINFSYVASALGHVLITNSITNHTSRKYWQTATIGFEAFIVGGNYGAGIRVKW